MSLGLILALGILTSFAAQRIGIPDVAALMIVGILIGPRVLGLVDIKADSTLNQIVVLFGASYILFDGGAALRLNVLRQVWVTIVVIATVGLIATAAMTGLAAHILLGLPGAVALLLGATIASTDPATLVPMFRQLRVRERVAQTVVSESAFNDPVAAILTFGALAAATTTGEFPLGASLLGLIQQAVIGIVAGGVLGIIIVLLIAHERWSFLTEYAPAVTLVAVAGAYFVATGLQASGFMAVFVVGIIVGNKGALGFAMEAGDEQKLGDFVGTTAFIMRLFIFMLLGTQVDFALMRQYLTGGIAVVALLMLVIRPIVVFACALPDRRARWSRNEMLFMCWTRETGVIPAALANFLVAIKAPGAQEIESVTFIAILMTILIQAPTTRWLGARLGLREE